MQKYLYGMVTCLVFIFSFGLLFADEVIVQESTGTTNTGSSVGMSEYNGISVTSNLISSQSATIHSIPGYGDWYNPSSWSENRIPTESDIVEINGIIVLNQDVSVNSIIVNEGGELLSYYNTITVKNSIESHGKWSIRTTTFDGDITFGDSTVIGGNLNLNNHSITLPGNTYLTVSGAIFGTGTFYGNNISLNTYGDINAMNLYGSGLDLHIYGSQTKIYETNINTRNVTMHSGATLTYFFSYGSPMWMYLNINTNTLSIQSGSTILAGNAIFNINGNLLNHGMVNGTSMSASLNGGFINHGTWNVGSTTFNGDISLGDSTIIGGKLNLNNHSITLPDNAYLTVSGGISGTGIFYGNKTSLNTYGDIYAMNLYGSGLDLHIYGPQTRIQNANIATNNVIIHSGAMVTYFSSYGSSTMTNTSIYSDQFLIHSGGSIVGYNQNDVFNIYGDIINNGSIYNITVNSYKNIENNGVWSTSRTYAVWPNSGTMGYNIVFDPGTSTGFTTTATSYDIRDKISGSYHYTVTPNNAASYPRKCINIAGCISSGGVTPVPIIPSPSNITPKLPIDLTLQVFPQTNIAAIFSNTEKNNQTNTPTKDALDPVDLSTGDFTYSNTLMHLEGDGIDYDMSLSYKSQVEYSGVLGYNWDHNYDQRLIVNTGGSVTYNDGKLGKYTFATSGSGYLPLTGLGINLSKTASGNYQMEFKNGDVYSYNSDFRISEIQNRDKKTLSFFYGSGNLVKVRDTLGRDILYSYAASGLLERVMEPGGRQIEFTYFTTGSTLGNERDLENIKIKNRTDEKIISFTYSKNTDAKLAHNILTMTDSKGAIYVTNTYDTNDRVLTQKYGDHTGSYEYTTQDIHTDDTISTIGTGAVIGNYVTKNRARDRSGNMTDYSYNRMGNVTERTSSGITTKYTYDALGQLTSEILPKGNGTKYSYDSLGNKIEIRKKSDMTQADNDATDIVTKMAYTGAINTIESIIDPLGNLTIFESDVRGNITKITKHTTANTAESLELFVYNSAGHLVSKTDANGNITTFEYNQVGKPTKITKGKNTPDETITTYTYDAYGNPLTETDGRGNIKTLTYDAFDRLTSSLTAEGIVSQYLYDANNNQVQSTVSIIKSDTIYNLLDKPTTVTTDIDANRRAKIEYIYDADDRLLETLYPNGQKEKSTYDTLGRLTKKEIIGSTTRTTSYTYDNNSNVLSETINGLTTTFSYDAFDRLVTSIDPLGTITQMQYDKNGNILESIVKNQTGTILKKTTTEYNRDNRPTKITEFGNTVNRITTRVYDNIGNLLSETNPSNQVTTYTYDALNHVKTTTLPNGVKTENTYDKNGNIIKQQIISPDKTLTTTSSYNRDNRKISTTDTSSNTTSYTYNKLSQITSIIDPKGIATTYTYDYRGKVLTESRANKTIMKAYDLMGNLTQVTDANGNITKYEYNRNNELISETLPDNKKTSYTYDNRGNIATKTDPNGTVTTYAYDSLNRITRKDYALGDRVGGVTYETYVYDPLGRLMSSTDSVGKTISFNYDLFGNLISEANGGKVVNYTYDLLGNKLTTQTPANRTITNIYDNLSRITTVKRDNTNIATYTYDSLNLTKEILGNGIETNYAYDNDNRMNQIGNDILSYDQNSNITQKGSDTYVYDQLNQLTQAKYTDKRYGTMEGNGYNYDLMGSRQSEENLRWITKTTRTGVIITTEKKKVWNYTINILNQYQDIIYQSGTTNTGATSTGITNTGTSTGTGEVGSGETSSGEIDTDTGMTLEGRLLYDNNGNLIGNILNLKRQYEYIYDANNRLIEISRYNETTGKEIIIQMTYDSLGRRSTKQVQNQRIEYIYSGNDVIEETMSIINPTTQTKVKKELREYIYGSKGTDDIISVTITPYTRVNKVDVALTPNSYYYEKDHLGSITRITTNTGGIVDEYSYTVFGKAYKKDPNGVYKPMTGIKSLIGNTRLYTGREYDREINLYYNRARYYNASLGRFISRDPIGMQDDINLYKYTRNSPVLYTDRDGMKAKIMIIRGEDYLYKDTNILIKPTTDVEIDFLIKSGYKRENIDVVDIKSIKELEYNLMLAYKTKYSGIIGMFHGDPFSISITTTEIINMDTLKQLSVPSDFDIPIRLDSCNTGLDSSFWNDSIGEEFARQIGTEVTAPNGFVQPIIDSTRLLVGTKQYNYDEAHGLNQGVPEWAIFGKGHWNTYNY